MTKLLSRLQRIQPEISELLQEESPIWNFSHRLHQQPVHFYQPLLRNWRNLGLEYEVLRAQIANNLMGFSLETSFKQQLIAALVYAEILEGMNRLINNPQERKRLQLEQTLYRHYLRQLGIQFTFNTENHFNVKMSFSDQIRNTTASTNWPRLMVVRVKRLLDTLVPVFKNMENFRQMVAIIDAIANPLFAYLAWIFYTPRLAVNGFNLIKNTVDHQWMDPLEHALGWELRLFVHWQKLWFELCNDSVWLTVGLVNCFVFTGVLASSAVYLTVSLYIFDVLLAGIRAWIEIDRFHQLSTDYAQMTISDSEFEHHPFNEYKGYLEQYIHYEKARLWLSVGTTCALFCGMLFALPIFAINPLVPLAGAGFIVLTCLTNFYLGKKIDTLKPQALLPDYQSLPQIGFFKSSSLDNNRQLHHVNSEADLKRKVHDAFRRQSVHDFRKNGAFRGENIPSNGDEEAHDDRDNELFFSRRIA